MARGTLSQVVIYEPRVKALESEIASWDATIAELRRTVNDLVKGGRGVAS